MNIFFLSTNPKLAALDHCDQHVVKMVLETTQMLCTAHRILDGDVAADAMGLYRTAYANHPMTKWVRENQFNYSWAYSLLTELCDEYTYRYDKVHATESKGLLDALQKVPENICNGAETGRTIPPMCMPDKYKFVQMAYCRGSFHGRSRTTFTDVVDAYRRYYVGEKKEFARWTKRSAPKWWPDLYLSDIADKEAGIYCVLCGNVIDGYGNNPWPLKTEGRCCDACNVDVVVTRARRLYAKDKVDA